MLTTFFPHARITREVRMNRVLREQELRSCQLPYPLFPIP